MVRYISDRVAVMYLGKIVELGSRDAVFDTPAASLHAGAACPRCRCPNPRLERQRQRIILEGDVPSPAKPPAGCRFNPRCALRDRMICRQTSLSCALVGARATRRTGWRVTMRNGSNDDIQEVKDDLQGAQPRFAPVHRRTDLTQSNKEKTVKVYKLFAIDCLGARWCLSAVRAPAATPTPARRADQVARGRP